MDDCGEPKGCSAGNRTKPMEAQSTRSVERTKGVDPPRLPRAAQAPYQRSEGGVPRTPKRDPRTHKKIGAFKPMIKKLLPRTTENSGCKPVVRGLLLLILIYQKTISPWLGPHCRFFPSCSQWAREAIETYGVWRGAGRALLRLLSCHPFHPGGPDPLVKSNE